MQWTHRTDTLPHISLAGLGAVATGIVPKMAIRFASFERYKAWLTPVNGTTSGPGIFVGTYTYLVLHLALL